MPAIPVTIPLINPNEPEALLAELTVEEGQQVQKGQTLCTLETTKSTADVLAEADGYIAGLHATAGQMVKVGELLCYIADAPNWQPESPVDGQTPEDASLPQGLRITQPALALAKQQNLDLSQLPSGPLITESTVQSFLEAQETGNRFQAPESVFSPRAILVYGGGGHGKMLIDLLSVLPGFDIAGVIDDGLPIPDPQHPPTVLGIPVLGGKERLPELYEQGVRLAANAVGGIGNIGVRVTVFHRLAKAGMVCPSLIHPSAFVESSANLAPGAQVLARAYVGSAAEIDYGVIVNTGAIISHDCHLEAYAIVSPGAVLAGEVLVGKGALIGMGVTVNLRVQIGAGARIGNGATVKNDVPPRGVVRAGSVWPA